VSVVLPWSMWPMVPTLRWGLFRSNFSLAMTFFSWEPCGWWFDDPGYSPRIRLTISSCTDAGVCW
jgi:hypothetical protein